MKVISDVGDVNLTRHDLICDLSMKLWIMNYELLLAKFNLHNTLASRDNENNRDERWSRCHFSVSTSLRKLEKKFVHSIVHRMNEWMNEKAKAMLYKNKNAAER
jgi:hypothetical protein